MKIYNNILETIGDTPIVKLNKIPGHMKGNFYAKVETSNPGNSVKDRMAIQMIEDAEKQGLIKPGGTIIEGTSGNTGMGLALGAIVKGYKLICTLSDKQSKEKMDILRAVGAEVIVCPTNVEPEDPRSYYSVAKRLNQEIPNSWYVNQYDNPSNAKAHYLSTGPEIWEQTDGKITHFVVGVGTGGTISGIGKYLKEKNPDIKIIGIDTYGSVFKKYHETGIFDEKEIYPYITEGIGEDILPKNVDFDVIDHFEKVTDKDAAILTRRLALEEGLFVGNSAGSAMGGILQLEDMFDEDSFVVTLFHDHGSRYVGKMFNDEWMRERGFLTAEQASASELVEKRGAQNLIALETEDTVSRAVDLMRQYNISQIPVRQNGSFVGSLNDNRLYNQLMEQPELKSANIQEVMEAPFPVVSGSSKMEDISKAFNKEINAVMVELGDNNYHILTKHDVIGALA